MLGLVRGLLGPVTQRGPAEPAEVPLRVGGVGRGEGATDGGVGFVGEEGVGGGLEVGQGDPEGKVGCCVMR